MDSAEYALLGIVIGALLSGLVQLYIEHRRIIRQRRAAAKILWSDVLQAMAAYEDARVDQRWWTGDLSRTHGMSTAKHSL